MKIYKHKLKISIDDESVNIYIDMGDLEEPIHVVYWHIDEVEEDANVALSMANAIYLYFTNPQELLNRVWENAELVEGIPIKYTVTDIKYDTDGELIDLPTVLEIVVPVEIEDGYEINEYVSDEISNITGFCHKGFNTTPQINY